jgi:ABC-type bacteriocin/lantibiotic exporter with double-glycine peptidase domain
MTDGFSCGPRSLQIAFSFFDFYPPYEEVLDICRTSDETGTSVFDLYQASQHYDFEVKQHYSRTDVPLLLGYLKDGYPVIIMWYAGLIEGGKVNHFSVAYKYDKSFIYLLDPAAHLYIEPEIKIRHGNLNRAWTTHPDRKWMMAMMGRKKVNF